MTQNGALTKSFQYQVFNHQHWATLGVKMKQLRRKCYQNIFQMVLSVSDGFLAGGSPITRSEFDATDRSLFLLG